MKTSMLTAQEFKKDLYCSVVYENGPFNVKWVGLEAKGKTIVFRAKFEVRQDTYDPFMMFVHLVKDGKITYNMDFTITAAEPRGSGLAAGSIVAMHNTVELPKPFDLQDADRVQFGIIWKTRQGDRRLWVKSSDVEMIEEGTAAIFKLA